MRKKYSLFVAGFYSIGTGAMAGSYFMLSQENYLQEVRESIFENELDCCLEDKQCLEYLLSRVEETLDGGEGLLIRSTIGLASS